jgi:putative lipoic acid-binding regulatory protein
MSEPRRIARKLPTICLLTTAATCTQSVSAFGVAGPGVWRTGTAAVPQTHVVTSLRMAGDDNDDGKLAGSFFNQVPEEPSSSGANSDADAPAAADNPPPAQPESKATSDDPFDFDQSVAKLMARRNKKPLAATPSTIGGVPTAKASGFGKQLPKAKGGTSSPANPVRKTSLDGKKSFVQLGKPLNDVNNPEYDDQGYTLYADEETGEKKRVFEALVEYPCRFTMKIVGANEGAFAAEMVQVVAESCEVEVEDVENSVKVNGKWTSVTVQAPVKSAEMLYALYEAIDRDPRVKFKF